VARKQNDSTQARQDPEPTVHAYDDPRLGPRAFLLAIMHSPELPIRDRMDAAARLLRLYGPESFAPPKLCYRIEGIPSDHLCAERHGSGSERRGSSSDHPPEVDNGQSNLLSRSNNHGSHDGQTGDPNFMTTNTDPLTFDQIQEIKAVVLQLRPDLSPSDIP